MKLLKLSFALILIGSVLLLNGASGSEKVKPSASKEIRTDEHKTSTQKIKKPTPKQPEQPTPFQTEVLETLRGIVDQQKAANKQNATSQKSWDSPSVLLQIALVLVAIAYTFFAARQWWATRILADLERPWIVLGVNWIKPKIETPFGGPIEWSADNIGRSPAFLTGLFVKIDIMQYPLPETRPNYEPPDRKAKFIIPPQRSHGDRTRDTPLDAGKLQAIYKGNKCLVVYGKFDYEDSSGNPHITRFCATWSTGEDGWYFEPIGPPAWIEYT